MSQPQRPEIPIGDRKVSKAPGAWSAATRRIGPPKDISTGKSIGRFNERADAVDFAVQAVRTTPELKDEDPQIRPDQAAALVELRKALRGTKY